MCRYGSEDSALHAPLGRPSASKFAPVQKSLTVQTEYSALPAPSGRPSEFPRAPVQNSRDFQLGGNNCSVCKR